MQNAEKAPPQKDGAKAVRPPTVAGIVAEYNPFHTGHKWMIDQLRGAGVDYVVCVMSGDFVQRASGAILPCHVRAKAALLGGVDLVLRLPVSWATASAESFAQGSVGLLAALGCVDLLAFGAECGDLQSLENVVQVLYSEDFAPRLFEELSKGISFASARAAAAESLLPGAGAILNSPNNILGIEYLKALKVAVPMALRQLMPEDVRPQVVNGLFGKTAQRESLFMLPVATPIGRLGAKHDGTPENGIASASWLRAQQGQSGVNAWQNWVPKSTVQLYQKAQEEGLILDEKKLELIILSRLRSMPAAEMARHPGAGEGLENRLAAAAQSSTQLQEVYTKAKSKRFAHSRIRRLALSCGLNLPLSYPLIPPFAHMLAANKRGLALLKLIKQKSLLPVSTSLAKLKNTGKTAAEVANLEGIAENIYELCLKNPQPGGGAFTRAAKIVL